MTYEETIVWNELTTRPATKEEQEEEQEVEDDYVPWKADNIDGERERRNGIC